MSWAERWRCSTRLVLAAVLTVTAALVVAQPAAAEEVYPRPAGTGIEFLGHGWGHGIGMSQYGSLGGARAGFTYEQILAKYYTGTTLGAIGNPVIRVRVASLGSSVQALPAAGLQVSWNLSTWSTLPTSMAGKTVTRWRIVPVAKVSGTPTRFRLEYLPSGSSTWSLHSTASVASTGGFRNAASGTVATLRGSTSVVYRGEVRGVLVGSAGTETLVHVVALPMDSYLRAVLPSESPSSWPAAALRAQAVAARSFAEYHRRYHPLSRTWYDVYDDTRSQVFPGTRVGSVSKEYASSDAAVSVTAGKAMLYSGLVVYAQFGSSNGGFSAAGSKPYLKAAADPWDAVAGNPNNTWKATVALSRIEAAYPTIGRFHALRITSRTGLGAEGGRVLGVTVQGAKGSVATTGTSFASRAGLKHHWFTPQVPASSPSYPRDVTADGIGDVVAVEASTGVLKVYPRNASGGWAYPIRSTSGWNSYAKVLTAGTWDGDPVSDLIVQDTAGALYLRSGTGAGTFGAPVPIGAGWTVHNHVFPVGDFDGDSSPDLMARRTDGNLYLYAGNGRGRFKTGARLIGAGWNVFNSVLSPGDFTGDGFSDVIGRTSTGTAYLYAGNGAGGLTRPIIIASDWAQYTALTSIGDFTGDGKSDVLGRTTDGRLWVIRGTGSGGVSTRTLGGIGWNAFSRILL